MPIRTLHRIVFTVLVATCLISANAQPAKYAETPYATYFADPMQVSLVERGKSLVHIVIRGIYPVLQPDGASYFTESRLMECNKEYLQTIEVRTFTADGVPLKVRETKSLDGSIQDAYSFLGNPQASAKYISIEPSRLCNVIARWLHQNATDPNLPTLLAVAPASASKTREVKSVKLERTGGVYAVAATINSTLQLKFIVDTGASDVSIPSHVGKTLFTIGAISKDDVLGSSRYTLADGSTQSATVVRLRSLKIGDIELQNVRASIMPTEGAPLLLGQSALRALGRWRINSEELQLEFQ